VKIFALLLVSLMLPATQPLAAAPLGSPAECHAYGADSVTVSGRLVRRVYPGRPNYESVTSGDRPDTVLVLRLDRPLCTRDSAEHRGRARVAEVQLYLTAADFRAALSATGQHLTLRGVLLGADFGWHHLPVLLRAPLPARLRPDKRVPRPAA
jgi:hypothetical protein